MPRIDRLPSAPALDVAYEDVRQSFLVRLQSERANLAALIIELSAADSNAALAFGKLEGFAHRLRGAAAVFDFPELRDFAKTLEFAALEAATQNAPVDEPAVQEAAHKLEALLSHLIGGAPSADVAPDPIPAN